MGLRVVGGSLDQPVSDQLSLGPSRVYPRSDRTRKIPLYEKVCREDEQNTGRDDRNASDGATEF